MIFIDSNIPMYLVGEEHPNKALAVAAIERAIGRRERLVTSAEVFQEILHRYRAIDRRDAIQPAFDALEGVTDAVFSIEQVDVNSARDILLSRWAISARDALHVAVMKRFEIESIMSFDAGFDGVPGLTRLPA